jgi:penicillin-binding protein 2
MFRRLVPSMFQRRLWLLFLAVCAAGVVMAGKAFRLTVVNGAEHLADAERRLVSERWTPTVRGRILDRKGRVLAKDEASFDILVDYPLITGEWAWSRATRQARRENRTAWGSLSAAAREEKVRGALPAYEAHLEGMWQELASALSISREEMELRRTEIRSAVQSASMAVWSRWLEERREEETRNKGDASTITLAEVQRPLGLHVEPHVIARGVDERVAFEARRLALTHAGLRVEPSGTRVYPYETVRVPVDRSTFPSPMRAESESGEFVEVEGVATHVLGWMRGLQAEDVASRPRVRGATGRVDAGHYQTGDRVGATGIERGYEAVLRGERGRRVIHLDKALDEEGYEEFVEPKAGRDVTLTLDIHLQARVQSLMDPSVGLARVQSWHRPAVIPAGQPEPPPEGTALNGAAVVYEIDSGEVLALVSTPTFSRERFQREAELIFADKVNSPWVNRAIAKPFPPGSIVKPIILSGAVTEGVYSLSRAIECTGHLIADKPTRYRCWVYKQFGNTHSAMLGGPLLAPEAMAVSCNIFFYTLARELGPRGVAKWFGNFGVGEGFGLGIGDEYAGTAGERGRVAPAPPTAPGGGSVVAPGEMFGMPQAILMGIGQGPVAWTPLHAAEAYAILARSGLHLVPRIVRDEPPRARDLKIDSQALDAAIEGLRLAVNNELGTGHHVSIPGVGREPIFTAREGIEVVGKTGTAEAPDILGDEPPREVLREGDHSWFVVMVGQKGGRPKYVISVVMEYAGSGGRVSGPICNEIIGALVEEGYLAEGSRQ